MIPTGKLEKMEFHFFSDPKMENEIGTGFKVMYNPNTLQLTYTNEFDTGEELSTGSNPKKFKVRGKRSLSVTLLFDGTGASPSVGVSGITANKDVHKMIKDFLGEAEKINGKEHRPNFIMVVWGKIAFPCVLSSATVTYKLFKPDGTPIRAEVQVSLIEHKDEIVIKRELNLLSPDLTRSYLVQEGDRLDSLCQEMYKDPSLYLEVARINNLTNNRRLTPGQILMFPPIDKRN